MTPTQIEAMIDRICGLFPTSQIGRNTVKNTWTGDEFLLKQEVDDARKVLPLVMHTFDKFPSLKEVHNMFKQLRTSEPKQPHFLCEICLGSGWDSGERWENGVQLCGRYEKIVLDHTYTFVIRCECQGGNF